MEGLKTNVKLPIPVDDWILEVEHDDVDVYWLKEVLVEVEDG